ncbi:MAG: glycosyltransferase family 4 protein [Candidatus Aminicenantes bacterium]|nr:glycosyltransferase family 4 protein [Candidatus Aminicenantes bacterium]
MNVLMLAPEPFFQPRGTPISVYFRLRALTDLGHRVDLVTYPLGKDVAFPGLRIRRVPNWLGLRAIKIGPSWPKIPLDAMMAATAAGALARRRYDVVFSHEEAAFFGIALAGLFGVPHIYDMHSSLPQQLDNFEFSKSPLLKRIFTGLEDAVLKRSRSVIVICKDLHDYVQSKGFGGKTVFLQNFMDFNDFDDTPVPAGEIDRIKRETAPGGEKIIFYAGNFEPYQGIPLLVEAMARVRSKAVLLILGGSPDEHEAMGRKAEGLGARDRIRFVAKVPPQEVPRYLAAADVLVSPRVSGTNTPLKIYAFLKSGKPFVATKLYTHTQVLTDEIAVLAPADPDGFAAGLDFALASDEAKARAAEAKRRADTEWVYPRYLEKITLALAKATGRG